MSREHGVTLLESDMQEICNIVNEMQNQELTKTTVGGSATTSSIITDKTTTDIKEYSELFKKYYAERLLKCKEYIQYYGIEDADIINSIDHPDYFEIDKEWDKRRKILDKPILKTAKYKVNQELEFIKTNDWWDASYSNRRTEKVLSHGIVTHIHTSDNGSGEIVYCFETLEPPCPECNPYCLESNVIRIFKKKLPKNVELKNIDGYSFDDLLKKIDTLTEENAQSLLSEIYSDSHSFDRKELRIPIAKSHKKRLIKNLKNGWNKTDLKKLENCFKKCGLTIY